MINGFKAGTLSVLFAVLIGAAFLFTGCGPTMSGAVKEDVSLTEQTGELEQLGSMYRGPDYNIAILQFDNRTPSGTIGVGEAATDILRTIVKQAGLEPVVLTKDEMKEQERLIELQQTGALRKGRKDAAAGFESVDFRISGSITSYAEVEESINTILTQSKTRIARVQVDYALVDVSTGKTLLSESGLGEYRKKTGGILGLGSRATADPGLRDGALRDALSKAMSNMIEKLNAIPFKSRVVLVEGPSIIIRAGTRSRLEPGTTLGVYRPGRDLIDPDTGRVLGKREKKIGEITLTTHQGENISEGAVKSGAGFRAGDVVKVLD
ncbi:MAG: CsgG/HfaB family protein [Thermodesulfobacteriota bacterium]